MNRASAAVIFTWVRWTAFAALTLVVLNHAQDWIGGVHRDRTWWAVGVYPALMVLFVALVRLVKDNEPHEDRWLPEAPRWLAEGFPYFCSALIAAVFGARRVSQPASDIAFVVIAILASLLLLASKRHLRADDTDDPQEPLTRTGRLLARMPTPVRVIVLVLFWSGWVIAVDHGGSGSLGGAGGWGVGWAYAAAIGGALALTAPFLWIARREPPLALAAEAVYAVGVGVVAAGLHASSSGQLTPWQVDLVNVAAVVVMVATTTIPRGRPVEAAPQGAP